MLDTLIHKYLGVPYRLHARVDKRVPKQVATVLFLHGIGNSSAQWDAVIKKLPDTIRVISIDLLGFGDSPSPRWLKYSTSVQAKAVAATLIRMNITQQLTIVGHSMGSLVAVEVSKRFPLFVKSLVLCSPPFYSDAEQETLLPNPNTVLKNFYRLVRKYPNQFIDAVPLATKLNIVGKAFQVNSSNVDIYLAALEASIINQTSLKDVQGLQKPIRILHGAFDPIVIKNNLDTIVKTNKKAKVSVVLAGHEMFGAYIPAIVRAIKDSYSHAADKKT